MCFVSYDEAILPHASPFLYLKNAIGRNWVSLETGQQPRFLVERNDIRPLDTLSEARNEAIDDLFASAILAWHHEIVDLLDHRIWRNIDRAAEILSVMRQIYVHSPCYECLCVNILEKRLEACLIAEAPM